MRGVVLLDRAHDDPLERRAERRRGEHAALDEELVLADPAAADEVQLVVAGLPLTLKARAR